ncbi:PilW family protein [Natronospora cellulosivora (SeqCode)]
MSIHILKNEKGFTLIELLAAIAISGIILSIIASLFIFVFNGFDAAQNLVLEQEDLLLIKNRFDNELKNAVNIDLLTSLPDELDDNFNYIFLSDDVLILNSNSRRRIIAQENINSLNFNISENNNPDSHYRFSLDYTINGQHEFTMILNNLQELNSGQNGEIIRYSHPQ